MPEPKRPLKVFLCHASTDKPKVRELYRYLKKRGIQPWFDEEDLVGGQDWQVEIPKALATSDAIIICLTNNSVDKEGYIQKEIKFALDKALEMPEGRIFLIPVKFEECEVPFTLSRYQWVDLTIESGYAKMMKALKFRASQLERSTVELPKKSVEEEGSALEKTAHEKTERETAEKVALEKAEREAAERTAKEQAKGESAEKAKQEKIEKEIQREIEKRIKKAKRDLQWERFKIKIDYWLGLARIYALPNTLFLIGIAFAIAMMIYYLKNIPALNQALNTTPQPNQILTKVLTPTKTFTPISESKTPTLTFTPTKFVTVTPTPLPTEITDGKGVSMVLVPAGEFTMGFDNPSWDTQPAHIISLENFYIDKFEVTNLLYKTCVDANICESPGEVNSFSRSRYYGDSEFDNYPVVFVDWSNAKIYCEWRNARLPTEAEWEKAARGTDQREYPWGNEPPWVDPIKANFCDRNCPYVSGTMLRDDRYAETSPVGSYPSGQSPYGVYDMAGNVSEWVSSIYLPYPYDETDGRENEKSSEDRVVRGGSWYSVHSTYARDHNSQNLKGYLYYFPRIPYSIGFRCVNDPNP